MYKNYLENDEFFKTWWKEANIDEMRVSISNDFDHRHNWRQFVLKNWKDPESLEATTPRESYQSYENINKFRSSK